MPEEAKEEQAAEPKKKSPIILIVILVIVGLALAGGISFFVTQHMMASSKAGNTTSNVSHDPGVFIKLGDEKDGILVNVGGIKANRFLKIGIVAEMNPNIKANVAETQLTPAAQTVVMDTTLQTLRSVKLEELDANKEEDLKTLLRDNLNKALGAGSVYEIYITSFLLQ